jgi:hypothetical protein
MSRLDQIVADGGSAESLIIDFRAVLNLDPDPDKQAILRRLLIEEVDRLAENREQLERQARLVRKGEELVRQGRKHLERQNGTESRDFQRSVELMDTIQRLFENFHQRVLDRFPYSVKLQDRIVGVCVTLEEARSRAQQFADANPQAHVALVDTKQARTETVRPQC